MVIIAILLVCLTGISAFFFIKEVDLRKIAEQSLQEAQIAQAKVEGQLKESQQQAFLLEEKYKEAKTNLENLQDDLELAQGVKQKMQDDNKTMTATIEQVTKEKEELNAQLAKVKEEVNSLQADLTAAQIQNKNLQEAATKASNEVPPAVSTNEVPPTPSPSEQPPVNDSSDEVTQDKVDLDKIVVASGTEKEGKVISVDADTGFLIANLGEKDGMARGIVLSVYRDKTYLGDVQVSRVLPEMSAADFIPPLDGQLVSKDDQVIVKK